RKREDGGTAITRRRDSPSLRAASGRAPCTRSPARWERPSSLLDTNTQTQQGMMRLALRVFTDLMCSLAWLSWRVHSLLGESYAASPMVQTDAIGVQLINDFHPRKGLDYETETELKTEPKCSLLCQMWMEDRGRRKQESKGDGSHGGDPRVCGRGEGDVTSRPWNGTTEVMMMKARGGPYPIKSSGAKMRERSKRAVPPALPYSISPAL
ncbi:hypothetical protein B296_00001400, partial [Ensete ventricosum]